MPVKAAAAAAAAAATQALIWMAAPPTPAPAGRMYVPIPPEGVIGTPTPHTITHT